MNLGLGTVQFGLDYGIPGRAERSSETSVKGILNLARRARVRVIDTAPAYGASEEVLGRLLPPDHNFALVTKVSQIESPEISEAQVQQAIERFELSERYLGEGRIYGLLLHAPSDLQKPGGSRLIKRLSELKETGRIQKLGVSIYEEQEVDALRDIFKPDIIQAPVNVFDQRLTRSGAIERWRAEGTELHLRSLFLQGALLMPTSDLPPFLKGLTRTHQRYTTLLKELKLTPLEGALAFARCHHAYDTVLLGIQTPRQLEDALNAGEAVWERTIVEEFGVSDPALIDPRKWRVP